MKDPKGIEKPFGTHVSMIKKYYPQEFVSLTELEATENAKRQAKARAKKKRQADNA